MYILGIRWVMVAWCSGEDATRSEHCTLATLIHALVQPPEHILQIQLTLFVVMGCDGRAR